MHARQAAAIQRVERVVRVLAERAFKHRAPPSCVLRSLIAAEHTFELENVWPTRTWEESYFHSCRFQHFKRMPSPLRHGPREDITGVETPLFATARVLCSSLARRNP